MTVFPLIIAPDPRLKTRSSPVEKVDDEVRRLVAAMFETMYHEKGIGLAAVQVGMLKRILVADVAWRDDGGAGKQYALINPEILESSDEPHMYKEGC
ncbi:MAG: peptide deformylase, partial [Pseudomonadota bacterium]|nr:peptide deformylase [Pseudomonadota bacterium]